MPESGFTVEGLITETTYDGFGQVQAGTSWFASLSVPPVTAPMMPLSSSCAMAAESPTVPGVYDQMDCPYTGAAYNGQQPETYPCFYNGGLWRIIQTGCGWEVQKNEIDDMDFEGGAV